VGSIREGSDGGMGQRRWRGHGARKPDPGKGDLVEEGNEGQSQCPIEGQFTVEGKGLATDIKRALV